MRVTLRQWMFLACAGCTMAAAQTLARPGWAGAKISREPWWVHGVFYRIEPARFQDSDGDGTGDLPGVAERLEYIQALGVDVLVVVMPDVRSAPQAAKGFDELTRQAASRHLRVLVEMTPDATNDAVTLAEARFWLNQGAAGLLVDAPGHNAVLAPLRALLSSFPGGRVLAVRGAAGDAARAQLMMPPPVLVDSALDARMGVRAGAGLMTVLGLPQQARTAAAVLLGSPNPVMIEAGQELGLGRTADGKAALMQWTPTDVTVAPKTVAEDKAVPEPEFKAFKPYVAPPPASLVGTASKPLVVETDAAPTIDPELLPGFTTAAGQAAVEGRLAVNGAKANVRDEERDPESVLSLYRRLVQLRHDDATLRGGNQIFLDEDALGALVWVRQAGAETRIVVCNLSSAPLHLSLDAELARVKVRGGTLRDLVAGGASMQNVQRTSDISLPAGGVMVGRVYR